MNFCVNCLKIKNELVTSIVDDYLTITGKRYNISLYLKNCIPSYNQGRKSGDICTIQYKTKSFLKVGEWEANDNYIEMNIYGLGLYQTSKFDPMMILEAKPQDLLLLSRVDYLNQEIPKHNSFALFLSRRRKIHENIQIEKKLVYRV